MINVKPAEGLRVRDPETLQVLPPEGGAVSDNNFWRRRLAAGDVVAIEERQAAPNEDHRHEHKLQPDSE